jgi:uncharacterized RDD family membrane protein YckC
MSPVEGAPLPRRYATFTRRFRAVVADTAIVVAGIMLVVVASDTIERATGSGLAVWLLMCCLAFLYEPLFVWRRGATIGHSMNQLAVVADGTGQRPGLAQALARYFIKLVLGISSFVTMALSRRHQTVHDFLTKTTVQLVPDADDELTDFHVERPEEPPEALPSRGRRFVVAFGYLFTLYVVFVVAILLIDSNKCIHRGNCSETMHMVIDGVVLLWLATSLASVAAVWKGLLLGARRRRGAQINAQVA